MSDKIIRIPKKRHGLYDEACKVQRDLIEQGYNRSLFDIMNDLMNGKEPRKPKRRGWSI